MRHDSSLTVHREMHSVGNLIDYAVAPYPIDVVLFFAIWQSV